MLKSCHILNVLRNVCILIPKAVLSIVHKSKATKWPPADKWINHTWSPHLWNTVLLILRQEGCSDTRYNTERPKEIMLSGVN